MKYLSLLRISSQTPCGPRAQLSLIKRTFSHGTSPHCTRSSRLLNRVWSVSWLRSASPGLTAPTSAAYASSTSREPEADPSRAAESSSSSGRNIFLIRPPSDWGWHTPSRLTLLIIFKATLALPSDTNAAPWLAETHLALSSPVRGHRRAWASRLQWSTFTQMEDSSPPTLLA